MDFDIVAQATEMGHPVYGDGSVWTMHQGDTGKIVPELDHSPYDVVLHDGSHERGQVATDLNNILPHIKEGGILLVHDTNHHQLGGNMCAAIDDSNLKTYKHERVTLPYSYGLTIIRLLSSQTSEKVQINWRPK
jgi:predicted O-methyltransferase YrrM